MERLWANKRSIDDFESDGVFSNLLFLLDFSALPISSEEKVQPGVIPARVSPSNMKGTCFSTANGPGSVTPWDSFRSLRQQLPCDLLLATVLSEQLVLIAVQDAISAPITRTRPSLWFSCWWTGCRSSRRMRRSSTHRRGRAAGRKGNGA